MKAIPPLDRPFKVWVQPTRSCNLNCRLCYDDCGAEHHQRELSDDELRGLVNELLDGGVISLFFEGGEPLVRPGFLDVLRSACPRALVLLRTNATLIDETMAADLKEIGVGTVCVDLLGARPETHDALTGSVGSYNLAIRGIRALVKQEIPVITTVILNRRNAAEMQEYLELSAALGVRRVGILRLYPIGRARRSWPEFALSLEECMAVLRELRPPDGVHLMQSWHPNDNNCCSQNAGVDVYGNSIGCPYLRELANYGNVRETSFFDTWNHPLYRTLRGAEIDDHCPDCAASQGAKGGCRSTAYAFHGRWDAPDPFCEKTNRGVDLRVLPVDLLQTASGPAPPSDS